MNYVKAFGLFILYVVVAYLIYPENMESALAMLVGMSLMMSCLNLFMKKNKK